MEVVTGDGVVVYNFDDINRLPRELANGSESEESTEDEPTDHGETEQTDSATPKDVDLEDVFGGGDADQEFSAFDN
jgi:hypothetical protein